MDKVWETVGRAGVSDKMDFGLGSSERRNYKELRGFDSLCFRASRRGRCT